ncbi:MAG: histidine phosphatase family protein [Calditrichia bacterium]
MIYFYLIRHGETESNKRNIFRGRADVPLNQTGIQQAESLAVELKPISLNMILSSPLQRAVQTAEKISRQKSVPIIIEEDLTNISLGKWEGQPKEVIRQKFPNLYEMWIREPEKLFFKGMEPLKEVQQRAISVIRKYQKELSHHREAHVAVVTHRAVLKPLIAGLIGIKEPYFWKIHMDTAAYSVIRMDAQGNPTLTMLNQTRHLESYTSEWS